MTEWLKHRLRCESRNSSISYFDAIFLRILIMLSYTHGYY